jgi:hypothetical protein
VTLHIRLHTAECALVSPQSVALHSEIYDLFAMSPCFKIFP